MSATEHATIVEAFASSRFSGKVDRERGIIPGVKILGFESKNGRFYPPPVVRRAVALYEGAKVNINHPRSGNPAEPRAYEDRFGVVRNARIEEGSGGGVYGDLHFNPKHSLAEQLAWDAEHNPESLGFSHNAVLRLGGKTKLGQIVVEEIAQVKSVDIVADPATTRSLFESEDTMDPTTGGGTPDLNTAMKSAFKQAMMAAIDDESLDMKATLKKLREIMMAQERLLGGSGSGASAGGDPPTEEQVTMRSQIALLQQELEQFRSREKQNALLTAIESELAAAGLDKANPKHVSELFSKQLLATESQQDRAALIADRAQLVGAKPGIGNAATEQANGGQKPVSRSAYSHGTEQMDGKSFAKSLLNA